MFTAIQSASATYPNIFLYCFFGIMASESFEGMADCIYNANWPRIPGKLHTNILIMMSNTQQPIYYDGFGILILNLQTFSSVSKCFKSILHCDLMTNLYLFQLTRAVMILYKSFWFQVSSSEIFENARFNFNLFLFHLSHLSLGI